LVDGIRFDSLTKTIVAAAASRRRFAGGLLGAASTLLAGPERTEAGRGRCRKGNFCQGTGIRVCDPDNACLCYKHAGGGHVCAAPGGECVGCQRDRDCRDKGLPDYRCVVNGRACCGGRHNHVCAAPCGTLPPCDGVTCDDACCEFGQACVGDPGACAACPTGGNLCDGNPIPCDGFGECFCVTSFEDVAVCSDLFGFCADCDSDDQCSFALGVQAVCIPAADCCTDFAADRACVPATCFGGGPIATTRRTAPPVQRLRPPADQPRRRWSARLAGRAMR
jgi:hypothetical protein